VWFCGVIEVMVLRMVLSLLVCLVFFLFLVCSLVVRCFMVACFLVLNLFFVVVVVVVVFFVGMGSVFLGLRLVCCWLFV